ncbi:MAG TPA: hypothetical protein VNM90_24015 [Haliangium sp.]|nr:hypothetical protein [Haliangium sp.]
MLRSSHSTPAQIAEISARFQRLKQALQVERDLLKISDVFWEDVAQEPWFAGAGHPAENARLRAITEHVGCHVLGEGYHASSTMLIHIPEHAFWHGCCALEGHLGQVLYFEDIDLGLLSVAGEIGSGRTHFVRFSSLKLEIDGKAMPSFVRAVPSA